jgi:MFS superfamily sulfate permease-like transporter
MEYLIDKKVLLHECLKNIFYLFLKSIWIITFIAVIILNVDVGFYVGLGCSIILLIYKSQRPKTYLLGSVDDSDIYVPLNKYMRAKEVRGVKIFQFCGPLNYADVNYFTSQLKTKSGFDIE